MLHPRFNHLGRSHKKPGKRTKEQQAADTEHAKFLKKMGIEPTSRRRKLKGITPRENPNHIRQPELPSTSCWPMEK